MKLLLILLLTIPYKKLTWADFKGTPPTGSTLSASSNTVISWQYNYDKENKTISHIYATPEFNPEKSWTKTDDPYVLQHEQGHLDLCKIVCNEVFRDVNPSHNLTVNEWIHIKIKYELQWDKLDSTYDFKTNHSLDHEAQEKWNKWIKEQLK